MSDHVLMHSLQHLVGEWAESVFTEAEASSIIAHLKSEVKELSESELWLDFDRRKTEMANELADIQMLIMHLAHREGIDLGLATLAKLTVNRARKWNPVKNDEGFWEHIPDGDHTEAEHE